MRALHLLSIAMVLAVLLLHPAGAVAETAPPPVEETPATPPDAKNASPTPHTDHRKRIAVAQVEISRHDDGQRLSPASIQQLSSFLTEMLVGTLERTGVFDVTEHSEMEKILNEQKISPRDLHDTAAAAKSGKALGVDMIMGGRLTAGLTIVSKDKNIGIESKIGTVRIAIDAQIIDVATGRILLVETGNGENRSGRYFTTAAELDHFLAGVRIDSPEWKESAIGRAAQLAVERIVAKMLETFPPETVIAGTLPDGSVMLAIGRFAGIKQGDQFAVMRETIIIDEETGKEVYRDHKTLVLLDVLEVQDTRCRCKVVGSLSEPLKKDDFALFHRKAPEPKDNKKP